MTEESAETPKCLVFACSGASNVGMVSFQAAVRLARDGFGEFSCIAGVGSANAPMVRRAKLAQQRVVIDGCPIGCAKKILDANRIPVDNYVIVTELGIDKTHDLDADKLEVEAVVKEIHPG